MNAQRRGFALIELLAALAILGVVMGTVTAALISLQRGMFVSRKRTEIEAAWTRLAEGVRDDLRRAERVTRLATPPGSSGEMLFETVRPDGRKAVYACGPRLVERRVFEGAKRLEHQIYELDVKACALARPAAQDAGFWELKELAAGEFAETGTNAFVTVTLELDVFDGHRRTVMTGAAMRPEVVGDGP